ncbi:hypothetical protein N9B38_02270 [bacterium]|nr:hypothetical protein [bacterium]
MRKSFPGRTPEQDSHTHNGAILWEQLKPSPFLHKRVSDNGVTSLPFALHELRLRARHVQYLSDARG